MSATDQPRQRAIKTAAVETLRADDTLTGWLYPDSPVPTDPADRLRIHEHDPGFEASPEAQIAVSAVASGGTWRGGQMSHSYIIQCTVHVTDDYYERWTSLRLDDIHDRLSELFETSLAPGILPAGPTGSGTPHEIQLASNDRQFVSQWRFIVHWTTRWP